MDELHRRVVRRIRELAKSERIPISHLPDRAGVSRSNYWEVLGGRTSPTLLWLGKIADALEVDVEALVSRPSKDRRT